MPEHSVTVVIPVAPFEYSWRWLRECLDSVRAQTLPADEVLLIDDMAGLELDPSAVPLEDASYLIDDLQSAFGGCRIWRAPWRLGVAHAFNVGVALARNELVFMACSDDTLEPECLERCVETWERKGRRDAYHYVSLRYMDTGEIQDLPAHQSLVTKAFWREMGGFPVETASGAPDAAFVSILLTHLPHCIVPVAKGQPLYNYRRHGETDTSQRGPWQGVILQTRNLVTDLWERPRWGRLVP